MPTRRTGLARGIPPVIPGSIRDGAGKGVVADHVPYAQLLNHDRLVLADEPGSELMQIIPPPVGDPGVYFGDFHTCPVPVGRSILLAGQRALGAGESYPVAGLMSGVGDLFSGRERDQRGNSGVDPHYIVATRQWRRPALADERNKPASGLVAAHCGSGGFGARRQGPRPADIQRCIHLREPQFPVAPAETRPRVLGRRTRPLAGLELRIARPLLPERDESALQMAEGLLKRDGGHIAEIGQPLLTLPLSQQRRVLDIRDAFPALMPRYGASLKAKVVHLPDAAKRSQQFACLIRQWIETVLIRSLHTLCHSSYYTAISRERRERRFATRLCTGIHTPQIG